MLTTVTQNRVQTCPAHFAHLKSAVVSSRAGLFQNIRKPVKVGLQPVCVDFLSCADAGMAQQARHFTHRDTVLNDKLRAEKVSNGVRPASWNMGLATQPGNHILY